MTEKSGIITTETWGDDETPGPIHLTGDVTLDVDARLTLLGDCEVIADGNFVLDARDGELHISGERGAPVRFKAAAGVRGGWVGIKGGDDAVFATDFEIWHATKGMHLSSAGANLRRGRFFVNDYAMWMEGSGPESSIIDDCWFEKNGVGWYIESNAHANTGLNVTNLRFARNDIGIRMTSGIGLVAGKGHRLWDNTIGIQSTEAAGTIDLTDIWWGSDSGPTEATLNADGTGDSVTHGTGTIDIDPWTMLSLYVPKAEDIRAAASRLLGQLQGGDAYKLALIEDDEIEAISNAQQRVFDSWYRSGLTKPLFAYGEETVEYHDIANKAVFTTDYRPIITIASVSRRTGDGLDVIPESSNTGWYVSRGMKESGRVKLNYPVVYDLDSIAVTYTHGYYDVPEYIRAPVIKLCVIDIYSRLLQFGADDVFAQRLAALQQEIDAAKAEAAKQSVWWSVV